MKKKPHFFPYPKGRLKKLWLMIRCLSLVLLLSILHVAGAVYSQGSKLSISQRNTTIGQLLTEIEQNSQFKFLYRNEVVDVDRIVSLDVKNADIETVLKKIFPQQDFTYRIFEDNLIVIGNPEAQPKTMTGTVRGKNGEPIPGVTVLLKGMNSGTVTGADGKYTIRSIPDKATLVFSFIGMTTREVVVTNQTSIDVVLEEESVGIEEVVAIGYGTAKKKDLTGSIASVRLENSPRADLPNMNILDALKGQMPGFDVGASTNAGGNPSIEIRGQNSILASNTPLIVLDGVVFVGSFNEINPSDIASVDVLKDASSAAVYGSRAANGVILITTKKGQSKKPSIRMRALTGIQTYTNRPEMRSPEEYIQMKKDVKTLNGGSPADLEIQNLLTIYEYEAYKAGNTIDWFDEVTRLAPIQDYQLSIAGKGEKVNYYVSGQLLDQDGIVYGDKFTKYAINSKVEGKITDWLTMSITLGAIDKNADGVAADLRNATINAPYSWKYVRFAGYENVYERYPQGQTTTQNPFWRTLAYDEDRNQNYRSVFSGKVDVPWIKGLNYTLNYSLNRWEGHAAKFYDERYYMDTMKEGDLKDQTKYLKDANGSVSNSYRTDWFLNHLFNYNRTIKDHSVDVTLLSERQSQISRSIAASGKDFSSAGTTVLGVHALEKAKTENQGINTSYAKLTQLAYMARANYVYKQRYHLSSSIRYDGYSGFAEGNKYGSFFSLAGAWTASEESFIKDKLPQIDYLKLRVSYGENGNPSIGSYTTFPSIASGGYIFGNTTVNTTYATRMANKALKWEKTGSLNFGVDFVLFNRFISGNIDLYQAKTTNLLLNRSIPIMNGFSTVSDNIGKVDNKGIEMQVNTQNIQQGDFKWSSGLNFWLNRNKVVSLYGLDGNKDGKEDDDIASNIFIGKSLDPFYTFVFDGIIQKDDAEYMAIYGGNPGDVKFKDLNRDGKISADGDRKIIGYKKPNFNITLSNTFNYKNLELYFQLAWTAGGGHNGYYMGENLYANSPAALYGGTSANWLKKDYWMPDHESNKIPRPNWTNPLGYKFPSRRDFVRLQDVSLSYRFAKQTLGKTPFENVKIFLAAKNLLTFSRWEGYDPETGAQHADDTFPVMKSLTLGVDISL